MEAVMTSSREPRGDRAKMLDFVSPPFAVRRYVVKILRSLPTNTCTALREPADDAWRG